MLCLPLAGSRLPLHLCITLFSHLPPPTCRGGTVPHPSPVKSEWVQNSSRRLLRSVPVAPWRWRCLDSKYGTYSLTLLCSSIHRKTSWIHCRDRSLPLAPLAPGNFACLACSCLKASECSPALVFVSPSALPAHYACCKETEVWVRFCNSQPTEATSSVVNAAVLLGCCLVLRSQH